MKKVVFAVISAVIFVFLIDFTFFSNSLWKNFQNWRLEKKLEYEVSKVPKDYAFVRSLKVVDDGFGESKGCLYENDTDYFVCAIDLASKKVISSVISKKDYPEDVYDLLEIGERCLLGFKGKKEYEEDIIIIPYEDL